MTAGQFRQPPLFQPPQVQRRGVVGRRYQYKEGWGGGSIDNLMATRFHFSTAKVSTCINPKTNPALSNFGYLLYIHILLVIVAFLSKYIDTFRVYQGKEVNLVGKKKVILFLDFL